jgi:site-specific DNA-methyltransferase (adenine-specific)
MDFMRDKPDKAYDLAIVDPPYGIGFDGENLTMSKGIRKDGSIRNEKSWQAKNYQQKYIRKEWDNRPDKIYFDELLRISKYQIIWGANYFTDYLQPTGGWIIWDKKKPPDFSLSEGEMAWTNIKNSLKIFHFLWHGYGQEKMGDAKEIRIHPTQKPVALYKWLLKNYAKPGQTIFDSHVGSGSSRIACYDMGFDFEGCELDADYHAAQEKRFADHIAQQDLFDKKEIQENIYTEKDLF